MTTLKNVLRKRAVAKKPMTEGVLHDIVAAQLSEIIAPIKERLVERVMSEIETLTGRVYKGDPGKDGYTPKKGVDYFDGEPGRTPIKGIDFFDGVPGDKGESIKGDKGDDGSPDTPNQVVEKVNTAEQKILQEAVKDLPKDLKEIRDEIKKKGGGGKGGGGVGQVQHERTNISSATTTVSTSFNIAGNGLALFAFYNGQEISRGTEYTVSGKTITLLFTPQDSTVFEVIYWRT